MTEAVRVTRVIQVYVFEDGTIDVADDSLAGMDESERVSGVTVQDAILFVAERLDGEPT